MAAAGGNHGKSTGPSPVDKFTGQRRLVAIGHRIDYPGIARCGGQRRATKGVSLDGGVDHMFALAKSGDRMCHRGDRIAGAFDNDIDCRMRYHGLPVVTNKGGATCCGMIQ